uniref:Uncharacterized protein n=1 Tax=Oryza brachyantha TaxID=4533 RepID=J3NBP0_ORYBR
MEWPCHGGKDRLPTKGAAEASYGCRFDYDGCSNAQSILKQGRVAKAKMAFSLQDSVMYTKVMGKWQQHLKQATFKVKKLPHKRAL